MAPLKKAPPMAEIGRSMSNVGNMEQGGRSATSLHAEQDSANIRSKVFDSQDFADFNFDTKTQDASDGSITPKPRLATPRRTSAYAPAIPSPLNPSPSSSSLESGLESSDAPSQDSSSMGSRRGKAAGSLRKPKKRPILTPVQQILRQNSMPVMRPDAPQPPKRLADLGRDYSRYPSQLSLNSRPSRSESTTALLGPNPNPSTTSLNPFSDRNSVPELEKWGYPDDNITAFNPFYGGDKGFILYPHEKEDDDEAHMPDPEGTGEKDRFRDHFQDRRSIISAIGGVLIIAGLSMLFILLPILVFSHSIHYSDPKDISEPWLSFNNQSYATLKNLRTGLIDPDTPQSAMTRISTFDGAELKLVFSDEFNVNNRTFYPGDDPFWFAPDIWYGATEDLEWYDPDAVTTYDGTLQLRMDAFPNHNLQYRSGMLNSWNQTCFKGGVMEVSASLPGPAHVPGLWPGLWTMGNLGRPGYLATTEGVWPYTYDSCDIGITPNQSHTDGLSFLPGQKLASCTCSGEDHPNPGTGRGAPEIDIIEASVDPNNRIGVVTQSFQVAPFDIWWQPNPDYLAIPNYNFTRMNAYTGGPYQQAISGTTTLGPDWYDGVAYQKFAYEYIPGSPDGTDGKIAWFVGEEPSFIMDGRAIGPNGNVANRVVSQEPMSVILNLGISNSWSQVLIADLVFPTIMHVDYVRIYQREGEEMMTCDPPGYPTTEYIREHPIAYTNPNLTHWNETGYPWPSNQMIADCT